MCRKHESPSLHNFLQGFSTSACEWLMPPGEGTGQYRVTVSDQLKRRDLLEDFIYWFFDSFVGPLLRTSFYITDSAAFNYQILYFRMDDWQTLCAPLLDRLTTETFQKIPETEAMELLRQRKLGFSFVRLLPKETGVRPIVNLKRKQEDGGSSINEILRATLEILNYEKVNQSQLLGASVFGPSDVYAKLKNLKANLRRSYGGALPKLYFVKVDVRACFDTIEQTKLLDILSQLLSEDAYLIKKHIQVNQRHDKSYRTTTTKNQAYPAGEHPHFLKYAADLASCIRDTIFIDAATCATTTKEEILELLEQHITDNVVKIGSEYFRQIVGIPQGSVLSTILCCFFYGDLEKRFKPFTKAHNLLLRHTDDYLFITPEYAEAKDFLDAMDKGHPEYGCFVSKEKTVVNFICDQVDNIAEHGTPGRLTGDKWLTTLI
ncbi:Telomerase reverse transcriptase [Stygiomarasmius scandens]|uniref:Telomerase reverse transcriptase n=1 Tax=Marasmiellus scandens TaxID=2682957 RepID=A0ABR1JSC1_9AGAR